MLVIRSLIGCKWQTRNRQTQRRRIRKGRIRNRRTRNRRTRNRRTRDKRIRNRRIRNRRTRNKWTRNRRIRNKRIRNRRTRNRRHYITLHYRYFIRHLHLKWPVVLQQSYVYASVNRWVFKSLLKVHVISKFLESRRKIIPCFRSGIREASLTELALHYWKFISESVRRSESSSAGQISGRRYNVGQVGRSTANMHQMHKYAQFKRYAKLNW